MRKLIYIFLISLILSGCSSWFVKNPENIITEKTVRIDPRSLELCKDLIIPEHPVTFESLLNSSIHNAELYFDCRTRQEDSVKLLKEFANIK
jgi:uncharacterized protein YcfL